MVRPLGRVVVAVTSGADTYPSRQPDCSKCLDNTSAVEWEYCVAGDAIVADAVVVDVEESLPELAAAVVPTMRRTQ